MKAIRVHKLGGVEGMSFDEIEKPVPQAGEILVKTAAAGINYADTMLRNGRYMIKPEPPFIPGMEVAGTVEAVGEGVTNFQVGSRVMGFLSLGGYAEYAVTKANQTFSVPENLAFETALALMAQGWTAFGLLRDLQAGQTVLIHAAAGGVGSILVQLAKIKGAKVIGTASSPAKLETVTNLGADVAINYTENDWVEQVLAATTDGKGVDYLIESVGGEIGNRNIECLKYRGQMMIYGAASGQDISLSGLGILMKNLTVKGYIVYDETPADLARYTQESAELIAAGRLKIIVEKFALADAAKAHEALEGRKTQGKVVLIV